MARGAADFSYQHVQRRVWTDSKFRSLSPPAPNAQTLWFFLLTGEYTTKIPGVIANAGRAGMAEFLDWPLEEFDRCFDEIVAQKMAIADWRNRLIYLPSAFKQPDNHPRSTSEVVAWRKTLNNLPECALRDHIEYDLRLLLTEMGPTFLTSFISARRTDLFSKRDDTKPLPAAAPTTSPAVQTARSPDPLPDPDPLPSKSTSARTRVDELAAVLSKNWFSWGTKVLTPDGLTLEAVAGLLIAYADALGEADLAAVAERAVKGAFVEKLLPSWSFTAPATPALFVKKWDEIQAVLGGLEPGSRAPPRSAAARKHNDGIGAQPVTKEEEY